MRTVDLGMLLLLQSGVYAVMEFSASGDIRNFAVGNGKVFVVTDSQLFQLQHDLVEEKRKDISDHTHQNHINILLPFDGNQTLITCGTSDCEVLNISDITTSIYREGVSVGPPVNKSSVSFLVDFDEEKAKTQNYMLVARGSDVGITLRSTLDSQPGGIFSKSDSVPTEAYISTEHDVEWIDGFQTSSPSHSYLLVNVKSDPAVVVLRMKKNKKKSDMIKSVQGAVLHCCDDKDRKKLLSSSVVLYSGSPLLWAGIFTAQEDHDPQNTALAIYNLSQVNDHVPSHFTCSPDCTEKGNQVLSPHAVVFKHSSMSSVAAEKKGSWIVVYIGTESGQLMQIVLDKDLNSGCVTVLYRSDDDRKVFPRMLFDPVDHKHIYIALRNQIRRVAVAQCDVYSTLKDCRASLDPLCGWCVTTNKCSTLDQCSNSIWISIPEAFFQNELITFQVAKFSEEVSLNLYLSAQGTGSPPLKCSIKTGSVDLCDDPVSVSSSSCSCNFSSHHLLPEGLAITATVTAGDQKITEFLKLRSCPDIIETSPYAQCLACVSAGCHWSPSSENCSWTHSSGPRLNIQAACRDYSSEKYTPEILSLLPNQVSVHGKNNAIIKGKNLDLVMKIQFQRFMGCNSKETPVLERSSDTLKFNIPSGNKGTVRVCVVTADGNCHSRATITYNSQPTCTGVLPRNTWASGKRKIEVRGSNLEYVEKIIVNDTEMSVKSTTVGVWFHAPPLRVGESSGPFTVSLRVGNSTVDCVDKLSYLPNPEFFSFSISQEFSDVSVFIHKKQDRLNLREEDVKVWVLQEEKQFECVVEKVISTAVVCNVLEKQDSRINVTSLMINVGDLYVILKTEVKHINSLFCV